MMRCITKEIATGSQDVTFTEVLHYGAYKLKVEIKSDSYKKQCYARVKRWSGNQWNLVHSINDMKTPTGLYAHQKYRKQSAPGDESEFQLDRDELLRVAKEILS
jgi:hypothetical protein